MVQSYVENVLFKKKKKEKGKGIKDQQTRNNNKERPLIQYYSNTHHLFSVYILQTVYKKKN